MVELINTVNHLSHSCCLIVSALFLLSRVEQTESQKKKEQETEDKKAIHEYCCMFDVKSPENSENWLGPFWVRSSGHISDCGMKQERPQDAEMDGGMVDHLLLRSKSGGNHINKQNTVSNKTVFVSRSTSQCLFNLIVTLILIRNSIKMVQ